MLRRTAIVALLLSAAACAAPGADTDPVRTPTPLTTTEESLAIPSTPASHFAARGVELVIHADHQAYVVLDAAPDPAWASGAPVLVEPRIEGTVAVRRAVDLAAVPVASKEALHQKLRLGGRSGASCEAVVRELVLVGRVSPDADAYARWRGEARDEDDAPLPAPPKAEIATEAWTLAEGSYALVGVLDQVSGQCDDATFAVTRATSTLAQPKASTDGTRRAALAAFRALPEHASHAHEYVELVGDESAKVPWDSRDESAPVVETITMGDQELVWVSAGTTGGCGDFNAELSALFRRTGRGLEPVRVFDGWSRDLSAVVLGATGDYELVFPEARTTTSRDADIEALDIPSYGCSC